MGRWWVVGCAIAVITLSGCGSPAAPTTAPQEEAGPSAPGSDRSPQESDTGTADERAPDAAPDFTVTTFDGDRFVLAEHAGIPVVINFFDSW
jgi:cytochrome oxidase Cu insertion factor (SCO1/SenC/PrrC family)